MNGRRMQRYCVGILVVGMMGAGLVLAQAQPSALYKPQFPGDPARSESEAQALGSVSYTHLDVYKRQPLRDVLKGTMRP